MDEAMALFTKAAATTWTKFFQVFDFRRVAELGLPLAEQLVQEEAVRNSTSFFFDPKYDKMFLDQAAAQKAIEPIGGIRGFAAQMAARRMKHFQAAVDSASLIFAHSVLDGVALDYCRATALADPAGWEKYIELRQVKLQELRASKYEAIRWAKIDEHLKELDRQSLMTKIDRLFAVCQPPRDFDPLRDYKFDRDRVETLDTNRHNAVHKEGVDNPLPRGNDDIWFMMSTANYLMAMVNERFGLKMDVAAFVAGMGDDPERR